MTWGAAYFAGELRLQMTWVERGAPALPAGRARGARPCVAPLLRLLCFGTEGLLSTARCGPWPGPVGCERDWDDRRELHAVRA